MLWVVFTLTTARENKVLSFALILAGIMREVAFHPLLSVFSWVFALDMSKFKWWTTVCDFHHTKYVKLETRFTFQFNSSETFFI